MNVRNDSSAMAVVTNMPGTTGFTMAVFNASDVPCGTGVFTHPPPGGLNAVPREFIEDIQRAGRLALKSKKLNLERMLGLAVVKHFGHLLATTSAPEVK